VSFVRQLSSAVLVSCVSALAVFTPMAAQSQALPTPQQLAARHDSLIGGRAALEARKSVRMVGTFAIPAAGIEAPVEINKLRPNKYLFRTELGPMGEILSGYDGTRAWQIQPGQPPAILDGAAADQIKEQGDFFGDFHDFTRFTSAETVDQTTVDGRKVYRVKMVRPNGDAVMEHYDVETGYSIGGTMSVATPMGAMETTFSYTDYKTFGGMQFATRVMQRNPQFEIIISIASVEFDTLDDAAVAVPEAVKALIKP
jgi:hypothetical protein